MSEVGLIRFILGTAGSGKTRRCIEEILSVVEPVPTGEDCLLLVPDQATAQYERLIVECSGKGALSGITVTGLSRLPFFLPAPGKWGETIGRDTERLLLYKALKSLDDQAPALSSAAELPGVLEQLLDLMDEMKRSGVEADELAGAVDGGERPRLSARLGEVALATGALDLELSRLGLRGSLKRDEEYAEALGKAPERSGLRVWIDGFSHFSSIEMRIVKQILRIAGQVSISLLLDPDLLAGDEIPPEDSVHTSILGHCLSTYLELDAIAGEMKLKREYVALGVNGRQRRWAAGSALSLLEQSLRKGGVEKALREVIEPTGEPTVEVVEVPGRAAEVRMVCRRIRRLVSDGARYGDFAVLTRSLENYRHMIREQFERYAIPFFLDSQRELSPHPAFRLVDRLVSYLDSPSLALFFSFARNPLTGGDAEAVNRFENFLLRFGKRIDELGTPGLAEFLEGGADREELSVFHSRFAMPLKKLAASTEERIEPGELSRLLLGWFEKMDVPPKMAEFAKADKYWEEHHHEAAWSGVISVLESLNKYLGNEDVPPKFLFEAVRAGLMGATSKVPPPSLDQVIVSEVERGRQMNPRYVFVIGMLDGEFPVGEGREGMISDEERRHLLERGKRLEGDSVRQFIRERYLFYVACTRASDALVLSVPIKQSPEALPSSFLDHLPDADWIKRTSEDVPEVPESAGEATICREIAAWAVRSSVDLKAVEFPQGVSEEVERIREGTPPHRFKRLGQRVLSLRLESGLVESAYSLEWLAACPFSYFADYDLRLRERPELKMDPLTIGTIYHAVLERALSKSKTRNISWRTGDLSTLKGILRESFDATVEDESQDWSKSRQISLLKRQLWESLVMFFETVIAALRAGEFEPAMGEVRFGSKSDVGIEVVVSGRGGSSVRISGRIDRLDCAPGTNEIVVVDYKSTEATTDWSKLYYGLDLQLLLYGYAVEKGLGGALGGILSGEGEPRAPKVAGLFRHAITTPIEPKGSFDEAESEPKQSKLRGFIRENALSLLERNPAPSAHSKFYGTYIKKDGTPGKYNSTDPIRSHDWEILWRWFEEKLSDIVTRLEDGYIEVHPVAIGSFKSCDRCSFERVCRVRRPNDVTQLPQLPGEGAFKSRFFEKIADDLGGGGE